MSDRRRIVVTTYYWKKPIPNRDFDWEATIDGGDIGEPVGHGPTEADAVYELYLKIEERELEEAENAASTTKR